MGIVLYKYYRPERVDVLERKMIYFSDPQFSTTRLRENLSWRRLLCSPSSQAHEPRSHQLRFGRVCGRIVADASSASSTRVLKLNSGRCLEAASSGPFTRVTAVIDRTRYHRLAALNVSFSSPS